MLGHCPLVSVRLLTAVLQGRDPHTLREAALSPLCDSGETEARRVMAVAQSHTVSDRVSDLAGGELWDHLALCRYL